MLIEFHALILISKSNFLYKLRHKHKTTAKGTSSNIK